MTLKRFALTMLVSKQECTCGPRESIGCRAQFIYIVQPLADADRPSSRAASSASSSLARRAISKRHAFIEIYFDLILVSFSVFLFCFARGFNAKHFCRLLFSSVFYFLFLYYFFLLFGLLFGLGFWHATCTSLFGQRLNSKIDGNLFFLFLVFLGQRFLEALFAVAPSLELVYPANDFIVLDVLMWALIVLFECHYVQALEAGVGDFSDAHMPPSLDRPDRVAAICL